MARTDKRQRRRNRPGGARYAKQQSRWFGLLLAKKFFGPETVPQAVRARLGEKGFADEVKAQLSASGGAGTSALFTMLLSLTGMLEPRSTDVASFEPIADWAAPEDPVEPELPPVQQPEGAASTQAAPPLPPPPSLPPPPPLAWRSLSVGMDVTYTDKHGCARGGKVTEVETQVSSRKGQSTAVMARITFYDGTPALWLEEFWNADQLTLATDLLPPNPPPPPPPPPGPPPPPPPPPPAPPASSAVAADDGEPSFSAELVLNPTMPEPGSQEAAELAKTSKELGRLAELRDAKPENALCPSESCSPAVVAALVGLVQQCTICGRLFDALFQLGVAHSVRDAGWSKGRAARSAPVQEWCKFGDELEKSLKKSPDGAPTECQCQPGSRTLRNCPASCFTCYSVAVLLQVAWHVMQFVDATEPIRNWRNPLQRSRFVFSPIHSVPGKPDLAHRPLSADELLKRAEGKVVKRLCVTDEQHPALQEFTVAHLYVPARDVRLLQDAGSVSDASTAIRGFAAEGSIINAEALRIVSASDLESVWEGTMPDALAIFVLEDAAFDWVANQDVRPSGLARGLPNTWKPPDSAFVTSFDFDYLMAAPAARDWGQLDVSERAENQQGDELHRGLDAKGSSSGGGDDLSRAKTAGGRTRLFWAGALAVLVSEMPDALRYLSEGGILASHVQLLVMAAEVYAVNMLAQMTLLYPCAGGPRARHQRGQPVSYASPPGAKFSKLTSDQSKTVGQMAPGFAQAAERVAASRVRILLYLLHENIGLSAVESMASLESWGGQSAAVPNEGVKRTAQATGKMLQRYGVVEGVRRLACSQHYINSYPAGLHVDGGGYVESWWLRDAPMFRRLLASERDAMRARLPPLEGTTVLPELGLALALRPGRDVAHGFFHTILHATWAFASPLEAGGAGGGGAGPSSSGSTEEEYASDEASDSGLEPGESRGQEQVPAEVGSRMRGAWTQIVLQAGVPM